MTGVRLPTTISNNPMWHALYREGVILNKWFYLPSDHYQEEMWAVTQQLGCVPYSLSGSFVETITSWTQWLLFFVYFLLPALLASSECLTSPVLGLSSHDLA